MPEVSVSAYRTLKRVLKTLPSAAICGSSLAVALVRCADAGVAALGGSAADQAVAVLERHTRRAHRPEHVRLALGDGVGAGVGRLAGSGNAAHAAGALSCARAGLAGLACRGGRGR